MEQVFFGEMGREGDKFHGKSSPPFPMEKVSWKSFMEKFHGTGFS